MLPGNELCMLRRQLNVCIEWSFLFKEEMLNVILMYSLLPGI